MTPTNRLKIAGALLVIIAIVALVASGAADQINADRISAWIADAGMLGPVVFVLLLALLQPLHVSVYVFLFTAVAIWDPWEALLYGWLGIQLAGVWSFVVSRYLARDFFERRVPDKIKPYLDRMEDHGFKTVFVTRILFYTIPAVQWSYGLTPVRMRDFVAGTALGTIPTTAGAVFLGEAVVEWWGNTEGSDRWWIGGIAAGVLITALMGAWWWRRRSKPSE